MSDCLSTINAAKETVEATNGLMNTLIMTIGIIGAIITAIAHTIALVPKEWFGSLHGALSKIAGNYGNAENKE